MKAISIPQHSPLLGRQIVHDPKSREYAANLPRRAIRLRSVQHRRYDPRPEPKQEIGCCTFVAECMLGNTVGNRVKGVVLDMELAVRGYSLATSLDPFPGNFPPIDTGSSGLAAAKAAVSLGISTRYDWYFGVDAALQGLQDHPLSVGGYWHWDMFNATEKNPVVTATGGLAGGHQWVASGYDAREKLVIGECWWGNWGLNGRFYLPVDEFAKILEEDGDVHYSYRKM